MRPTFSECLRILPKMDLTLPECAQVLTRSDSEEDIASVHSLRITDDGSRPRLPSLIPNYFGDGTETGDIASMYSASVKSLVLSQENWSRQINAALCR